MFNTHDPTRNEFMLSGPQSRCGYDWWWHSFTGYEETTGEEKVFFFEFFTCNPALGGARPVFGQLPENKQRGIRPSYLMVKAGAWGEDAAQIHRFFPWDDVTIHAKAPFSVEAGDCYLDDAGSHGHVCVTAEEADNHPEYLCSAGEMSWNLSIRKKVAFNVGYGAGKLLRSLQLFEMFWHAEGMKTEYEGEVQWRGRTYIVRPETCNGYADKNWGKDFTSPWVWISSNDLESKLTGKKLKNSVFDIGGGCPKIGPVALKRKLLSVFWYEGQGFEFNFSKFWTGCRTVFDCRETENEILWHVDQKTWHSRMVTDLRCAKNGMLLVNYEAPNGTKRHNRLWNGGHGEGTVKLYRGGKLIDEILVHRAGCEFGEYDR